MPRSISHIKAIFSERKRSAAILAQEDQRTSPRTLHHGFYPNQPRVPAGNSDGGQWTNSVRSDPRVLSDATPDNDWQPGAQYAQGAAQGGGGRGSGPPRSGGPSGPMGPGQAARLAFAQGRQIDAISRVRELDPNWKPRPSFHESVEGLIRTYEAETREAEARLVELVRFGIGPGPYATESIPARGPGRGFTPSERDWANRVGYRDGCHTCGALHPGTLRGNFVLDHQPPTRWNPHANLQRLFPQCVGCSRDQGLWIANENRGSN
jgi:hypothetical protein